MNEEVIGLLGIVGLTGASLYAALGLHVKSAVRTSVILVIVLLLDVVFLALGMRISRVVWLLVETVGGLAFLALALDRSFRKTLRSASRTQVTTFYALLLTPFLVATVMSLASETY